MGKDYNSVKYRKYRSNRKVLIFTLLVGTWLLATLFRDKTRQDKICFIPFRMLSETNE